MIRDGVTPGLHSYITLISGLCKIKTVDETMVLFKDMHCNDQAIALFNNVIDRGIHPDVHTYTIIIDGLCKGGRLEDSQEVFQDLLNNGYRLNVAAYNAMINGLCKEGKVDEPLCQKWKTIGCSPDAITFETIICALFERDENDTAEKLLHEMVARGLL
ncbi:pentatricopeptide repeat-containing protein At1g05670, mitochondrial-like [Abrus precatorius]|uniref:Pentatricopeptide repeat-containing protein At1g05670, mitochondrial-like n=1 Tax=Abrus precatorius TaxID=3816 RepID=A0A8B8K0V6_ABRPR|nr:pentatricopeptide repeat-containing protein At1g05670, mitochondrial-like [Abrus precatorius]